MFENQLRFLYNQVLVNDSKHSVLVVKALSRHSLPAQPKSLILSRRGQPSTEGLISYHDTVLGRGMLCCGIRENNGSYHH